MRRRADLALFDASSIQWNWYRFPAIGTVYPCAPEIADTSAAIISAMSDVTQILSQIESGDPSAAEHHLPLDYNELRKMAAQKLLREKPGQTHQSTA